MNLKQRQAVLATASKGCQTCGKPATTLIVWTFVDRATSGSEHPILAFVRCDAHAEEARAQTPQAPTHVRVSVEEETLKPLCFLS